MRALIIGGYGGHAGYAFAVVYELAKRGYELDVLLPKGYEYLAKKFENLGNVQYLTLPRKPLEPLYRGVHRWINAFVESLNLVNRKYDFVFSAGSNFSIPPSVVVRFLRRALLYVLEDINRFSKPAKAVRLLHTLGGKVLLHWEEQLRLYPNGVVVGPVYEPPLYEPQDGGYVFVTLGTLGSKDVFDAVTQLDVSRVVVQTGDVDPEPYIEKKPNWVFFKYTDNLHKWIANASIVVTHPGTTSVTARLAYGKPVVLVYTKRHAPLYPKSDVETLAKKLGVFFVEEITAENLLSALEKAKKLSKPALKSGSVEIARLLSIRAQ